MEAIVTIVLKDMEKYQPKRTGLDVFGRLSTDVMSRHKSFLMLGTSIEDIEKTVMERIRPMKVRISRIEVIGESNRSLR